MLGEAANRDDAIASIKKYRAADLDSVLSAVTSYWDGLLDTVQVRTPDRSMDLMLNRWLLYQTLACRVWARTAFYQAGGAYGFRDQIQDVMALTVAQPALTREQLIRAASRQFVAGDVQHWWLPPAGQGVRTRIADDRVWLPFAVAHYIEVTGDAGILDESLPFLDGAELQAHEVESFFQPTISNQRATVFDHCALALDNSLAVGIHGIPLFGSGDWNDGMNRVGEAGKGESTWMGWFLCATIEAFAPLADIRGDARASTWRNHAAAVKASLEREGWDGNWYRRGYFDDGTPLGSADNLECRIDSIAQSWSVISGAASPVRAAAAMAAVDEYLVRREDSLVLLFTPPVRSHAARPRLYQGLSARAARERRSIYPRLHLVGDRVRDARRRRQGVRAVLDSQPDQSRQLSRRNPALQSRTVRHVRRPVLDGAARRARRMDLVHGLGGMDVSGGPRVDIGLPAARQNAADRSVHPSQVAGLRA